MPKKLEQHSLAAKFIPEIKPEDFANLCNSIQGGYDPHYPIYLHEGKILIGWTRYQACQKTKVEPVFAEWNGTDPLAFILRSELPRRHMSVVQVLRITEAMRPELEAEAAARSRKNGEDNARVNPIQGNSQDDSANLQSHSGENPSGSVAEKIAAVAGVSERTVSNYHSVQEHGTPELKDAVDKEQVSISDAAAVAKAPAAVQNEAVKKVRKGKAKTLRAAVSEPEQPEAEKTDRLGAAIPASLEAVFVKANEFKEILNTLNATTRQLKELNDHPAGMCLRGQFQQVEIDMKNLKRSIAHNMPYCVCRMCNGAGKKSSCACKGRGWLVKMSYENLPTEYRE